ncbi:Lin1244/Lin1753 domain-containing protein, partial [Lacticaseibacillus paracasei]
MNSYFPHDSNARNDAKILKVRMKYGAEGYGVYFMLLERLRDDSEYMSVKDYNMIAFDLRVDASLIKDIVENFGLFAFADNGECFYSESFNKRMLIKDEVSNKRAAAGKKGAAKRWNGKAIAKPSSENSKDIAKPQEDDGNKSKVKESKVNKTKRQQTTAPVKAAERPAEEPSSSSSSILDICNFWEGNG